MRRKGVCFVGYGSTEYSRKSEKPLLRYFSEAMQQALQQTGLESREIRGFSMSTHTSVDHSAYVAEQLGLELDWILNADTGGSGGVIGVRRAADAIEAGHIDLAILVGGHSFEKNVIPHGVMGYGYQRSNYVDIYGHSGPNSLLALVQRRHMEMYGTRLEQFGKIAMTQRANARSNPQALLREPMSMDDYLKSRMISDPIRLLDCVMPCSGAECIILASEERAKRITDKLVYLVADAETINYQISEMVPDRTTTGIKIVGNRIFSEIDREKIDLVELYDDYPAVVLIQLEDLGFCEKGNGGDFVDAHDFSYAGDFPLNTGGGQLSVGQAGLAGGFLHIVEALRQLRGEAVQRQVLRAECALVTGVGWLAYGRNFNCTAALVMERRA